MPPSLPSSSVSHPFEDDSMFTKGFTSPVSPPRTSRPGNEAATHTIPYSGDDLQQPLPECDPTLGDGLLRTLNHTSPTKSSSLSSSAAPYSDTTPRGDLQQTPPRTAESNFTFHGYFWESGCSVDGVKAYLWHRRVEERDGDGEMAAAPLHSPPSPSTSLLTFPSSSPLLRPASSSDLYTDDSKDPHTQHRECKEEEEAGWHDVDISDDDEWEKVSEMEDIEWEVVAPHRPINAPLSFRGVGWRGGGGSGENDARKSGTRGVLERGGEGDGCWIWRGGEGVDGVEGVGRRGLEWVGAVVGFPAAVASSLGEERGKERRKERREKCSAVQSHSQRPSSHHIYPHNRASWRKDAKCSCKMVPFIPKTAQIRSAHTSQQAACPKPAGEVAEGGVSLRMRIEPYARSNRRLLSHSIITSLTTHR